MLDIFIRIDYTPISNDSDPYITIIDGINGQGIARAENNSGRVIRVNLEGISDTGFTNVLQEDQDAIIGLGEVDIFSFRLSIADHGRQTYLN